MDKPTRQRDEHGRWAGAERPNTEVGKVLAERLDFVADDQGLSNASLGRVIATKTDGAVDPIEMKVSRWRSGATPLITLNRDLFAVLNTLGLDPIQEITEAVRKMIQRQPAGLPMWVDPTEVEQ